MSGLGYCLTNSLGRSVEPPITGTENQFVGHQAKNLPYNYATANWVIERSREDLENPVLGDSFLKGDSLPSYSLFKFNLGRERPYSVVVNNRTECLQGSPIDGKFCNQCTPHPYDMRTYAPYVAPQPHGERMMPTPQPVLDQPLVDEPPYSNDFAPFVASQPVAGSRRAGMRSGKACNGDQICCKPTFINPSDDKMCASSYDLPFWTECYP